MDSHPLQDSSERLLCGFDIYQRRAEHEVYRYRMLQDVENGEYAIVQCDSLLDDFDQKGWETQEAYFQENLVVNWSYRRFYPTIREAISAFFEEESEG